MSKARGLKSIQTHMLHSPSHPLNDFELASQHAVFFVTGRSRGESSAGLLTLSEGDEARRLLARRRRMRRLHLPGSAGSCRSGHGRRPAGEVAAPRPHPGWRGVGSHAPATPGAPRRIFNPRIQALRQDGAATRTEDGSQK